LASVGFKPTKASVFLKIFLGGKIHAFMQRDFKKNCLEFQYVLRRIFKYREDSQTGGKQTDISEFPDTPEAHFTTERKSVISDRAELEFIHESWVEKKSVGNYLRCFRGRLRIS
jgi:hypothetical protein